MQITTLNKTERWLVGIAAVLALAAMVVVGLVLAAKPVQSNAEGPGQATGNRVVPATPAVAAINQAQVTRIAQLVAGYAATGVQPTRLEMARLEMSSGQAVTGAQSGPLRKAASAASVQQCVSAGRHVSNRLYVEFGPGLALSSAEGQAGTLTFLFRVPAGKWQIVAEATAGPERTGQVAGRVTAEGGVEPQVVRLPVTIPGGNAGLSLYAAGANDRLRQCDPAEGPFIGKPVLAK